MMKRAIRKVLAGAIALAMLGAVGAAAAGVAAAVVLLAGALLFIRKKKLG